MTSPESAPAPEALRGPLTWRIAGVLVGRRRLDVYYRLILFQAVAVLFRLMDSEYFPWAFVVGTVLSLLPLIRDERRGDPP